MKKFIIFFLVIVIVLVGVQMGFALSAPQTTLMEKQLLADGDMEKAGVTGWINGNSTLTKVTNEPKGGKQSIHILVTASTVGYAGQTILTTGKKYHITGWARGDGASTHPAITTAGAVKWSGTNSTSWQHFDITVAADGTVARLYAYGALSGTSDFDDVLVTEYTGSAQTQEKQLLKDGDMETSGTANYAAYAGGIISKTTSVVRSGKQAYEVQADYHNRGSFQNNVVAVGKKVRITGYARGDGTIVPRVSNGALTAIWTGTSATSWQYFDAIFTQAGTTAIYFVSGTDAVGTIYFDDVMVTEYKGGEQTIEKQLLVDGDMETSGTGSWTNYSNAIPTKTTVNQKSGRQALRVTYLGSVSSGFARNANNLTVGKRFRATGWARSDGTLVPRILTQSNIFWIGTNSTSWQRVDGIISATQAGILLGSATAGTSTSYVEFDDIMITEVP
ncbi:MAG: hypothetical protein PHS79_06085 [Patescibacteria group bacterium]|nr:hypothetical protein [Patescibacteria group bacterium]